MNQHSMVGWDRGSLCGENGFGQEETYYEPAVVPLENLIGVGHRDFKALDFLASSKRNAIARSQICSIQISVQNRETLLLCFYASDLGSNTGLITTNLCNLEVVQ